jgi:hypothetical protein
MTPLLLLGLFAVTAMLVCYALEHRGRRCAAPLATSPLKAESW